MYHYFSPDIRFTILRNVWLYTRNKNRNIYTIMDKDIDLRQIVRKYIGHKIVQNSIKSYVIV